MSNEISFCPVCAGKLEPGDDSQWICEECEHTFLIEIAGDDDNDDDDDEDEEEGDAEEDEDEDEEEEDDEY